MAISVKRIYQMNTSVQFDDGKSLSTANRTPIKKIKIHHHLQALPNMNQLRSLAVEDPIMVSFILNDSMKFKNMRRAFKIRKNFSSMPVNDNHLEPPCLEGQRLIDQLMDTDDIPKNLKEKIKWSLLKTEIQVMRSNYESQIDKAAEMEQKRMEMQGDARRAKAN